MKKLVFILIPAVLIIWIGHSLSDSTDSNYRQQVADIRAERIRFLKNSKESPFQQFNIKYQPPAFFPVDATYKVRADLERIQNPGRTIIQNSDGSSAPYLKFAYATFQLKGQSLKLLILKPAGFGALPGTYLTAFSDATSGSTTYGGGRYLDLEIGKSSNIDIDFNLAYNPYCAYTKEYSCPLPPPENVLPLSIEAGEKAYPEHSAN